MIDFCSKLLPSGRAAWLFEVVLSPDYYMKYYTINGRAMRLPGPAPSVTPARARCDGLRPSALDAVRDRRSGRRHCRKAIEFALHSSRAFRQDRICRAARLKQGQWRDRNLALPMPL